MEPSYKLDELAKAADVSPRTVRYYVQRGLLPPPEFKGRDTAYTGEHLRRLQAIKKLQEQYLPLDAIVVELERRSTDNILKTITAPPIPQPPVSTLPSVSWRRYPLRDGVEIHVRDDVAPSTASLVAELAKLLGQGQKGPYR